jgi:acyl-CoA synthetase (AMP-forming)/AMP-acid ligase II
MFVRLLRLPEDERARFQAPALKLVLHGAAPVSRSVKQRMIDWWGEILVEYWGATESGVITLTSSREWQEHPSVADAAVFGVPNDEWGESVKAAIELMPDLLASNELAAEILAFARERLAGYKVPSSIDFEDALPRHDSGKLYVRKLRDRYWQGRDRRI